MSFLILIAFTSNHQTENFFKIVITVISSSTICVIPNDSRDSGIKFIAANAD